MKTEQDLRRALEAADHRGYPAYKQLRGSYDLGGFTLSIDHVQGDPFAAPSKVSVLVPARTARLANELFDEPHRRVALEDFLLRRFARELARRSLKVGGSGKSGLLATSRPGPEVLPRSACEVQTTGGTRGSVVLRFEASFPAHGRTTDARGLERMLLDLVPACVRAVLPLDAEAAREAQAACDLADDQHAVREELERRGLVAFVADGSVLPRESGVSSRPLPHARAFASPEELAVTLDLPHRGQVRAMGVRRGVTLIVGGGYHGKSTLLRALQEGVYDHVAGDGRELVITDATAVKLRAEDGRAVHAEDISLFITDLPDGRDTRRFTTQDASGSTSQAAGAVEAIGEGCRALLIDEDTSATNFMVRDALMEAVVSRDHEPITPFVERVRDLWEQAGVSSIIVAGSSGAFFSVADTVVQMDCYEAHDITELAGAVCRERGAAPTARADGFALPKAQAAMRIGKGAGGEREGDGEHAERHGHGHGRGRGRAGGDRLKTKALGRDAVSVGTGSADLRLVEQLVDAEQTAAIAQLVRVGIERGVLDGSRTSAEAADALLDLVEHNGWPALGEHGYAACGLTLPRRHELIACLTRWRER